MAVILDETFAEGIPAGVATLRQQSGTPTAVWNSAQQAVDLTQTAIGAALWDFTSLPVTLAGEMEIDLEFLQDYSDGSNLRQAGIWATAGQTVVSNGVRFDHQDTRWLLRRWVSGTDWLGNSEDSITQQGPSTAFNTMGDRRVINLRWDFSPGAGSTRASYEARIDGGTLLIGSSTDFAGLRPGVFFYGSTVRLHSIKAWDAPQVPLRLFGATGLRTPLTRKINAPPAALVAGPPPGFNRQSLLRRRDTSPGARAESEGNGRVRGTVSVKGTPQNIPVSRKVRLVREKDGQVIQEVWSNVSTGAYDFIFVNERQTWTVISYDHTNDKRAVIADNLTLANGGVEMMP